MLRNVVRGLVDTDYKNILLNLRDVRHIDSAGVGELMSCYTSVRNHGGTAQADEPEQECPQSAADHQAVHHFRSRRGRAHGRRVFSLGRHFAAQLQ